MTGLSLSSIINDAVMRSNIDFDIDREIAVKVNGWDEKPLRPLLKIRLS